MLITILVQSPGLKTHTHTFQEGINSGKNIKCWLMFLLGHRCLVKTFSELTPAVAHKHPHSQSVPVRGEEYGWQASHLSSLSFHIPPRRCWSEASAQVKQLQMANYWTLAEFLNSWALFKKAVCTRCNVKVQNRGFVSDAKLRLHLSSLETLPYLVWCADLFMFTSLSIHTHHMDLNPPWCLALILKQDLRKIKRQVSW